MHEAVAPSLNYKSVELKDAAAGDYTVVIKNWESKDLAYDFAVQTFASKKKAVITSPFGNKPKPDAVKDQDDGVEKNGYKLKHKVESTANGKKVTATLTRTTAKKAVVEFWIWVGSLHTETIKTDYAWYAVPEFEAW